jgi:hypothetical protein
MNDSRYPYVEVEVPVPEKKQKYKRYQHEKRAKHPGTKRVQTPHIMVTKWDVENANTRNKKVGRNRDRAEKYGNWSENRTDAEDVNKKENELAKRVIRKSLAEFRMESLAELGELMFPVFRMDEQGSWPIWAWESYHERLEYESELAEMAARAKA